VLPSSTIQLLIVPWPANKPVFSFGLPPVPTRIVQTLSPFWRFFLSPLFPLLSFSSPGATGFLGVSFSPPTEEDAPFLLLHVIGLLSWGFKSSVSNKSYPPDTIPVKKTPFWVPIFLTNSPPLCISPPTVDPRSWRTPFYPSRRSLELPAHIQYWETPRG